MKTAGKTTLAKAAEFDRRNLESAKLILADVERYGGETAGLVIWARMAVQRIEGERMPQ